jgi:two-component system chemotaxis response regulator CheB
MGHDVIVIGGSTGSLEALKPIVANLPPNFPAAVFVVLHTSAHFSTALPEILSRQGPLKATHAIHGEPFSAGHIYVAPPDNHLVLRSGYLSVQRGPKENGHRPAVDPLFRSAAVLYGPRVVGVILSGTMDCGTAGMLSVKTRGGKTVVQDPADAQARDMPISAIKHVAIDHILPASAIGPLLVELEQQPVVAEPPPPASALLEYEGDEPGLRSDVVCPICQGSLTEAQLAGNTSFRCHVGHAFSSAALLAEQAESLERALWASVRALQESATLSERVAASSIGSFRARMLEKATTQGQQAEVIRRMLLSAGPVAVTDAQRVAVGTGANGPSAGSNAGNRRAG